MSALDESRASPESSALVDPRFGDALYEALRRIAAGFFRTERIGHTLGPTALVHEAWLRLSDHRQTVGFNRPQFMAAAACVMRRILVEHARASRRKKRGGELQRVPLDSAILGLDTPSFYADDIDRALHALARVSPRRGRIAELRFFAGLTTEEAAEVLGVSTRTIKNEWQSARAFLNRELKSYAPMRMDR